MFYLEAMMMDIGHDLILFIDSNLEKSPSGYLIFSLASAIFALLFILIDWAYFEIENKSFLHLTYHKSKIPVLLIAYVIGAGGVGFIGVIINILNFHILAAVGAGGGWPFIFPRIIASLEGNPVEQRTKEEE